MPKLPIELKWAQGQDRAGERLKAFYERARLQIRETIDEYADRGLDNLRAIHYREIGKQVDDILADLDRQTRSFLTDVVTGAVTEGSVDALTEAAGLDSAFNVVVNFSRVNPKLVNYHLFRSLSRIKAVNETVQGRIREQLAFGQFKGMHARAVGQMIAGKAPQRDNVLIRTRGTGLTLQGIAPVFPTIEHRALTIARTEMGDAANASFLYTITELDEEDGLPIGKTWDSTVDKRTSVLCLALGDKYGDNPILMRESFAISVRGKDYAFEAPTAHPNCRCRVEAAKLKGAALERWRAERRKRERN